MENNIIKIAITSSDGVNLDLHFGQAKSLYIYDFNGETADFIEKRIVSIKDGEKHQWQNVLNKILDCDVVIAVQVGFKSKIGIENEGLKFIEESGSIEDVLERFINHYKFIHS
ncbi:MAG: FeMo cofactor biosynthesis protein [Methanobrevibacter sp.]|jgi:predicted Fe-Mo cluster-binding NifX family protein|nr:FeMo cofactor biosynthesis protein [Methanobrevibacter sp.]